MIQAALTAISGLRASALRLDVAADNIANARTAGRLDPYDGYRPQRVVQTARPGGGVKAHAVPTGAPPVPVHMANDPRANADGLLGAPNVDLAAQAVDMRIAAHGYKANAAVLTVAYEMSGLLLDTET